MAGTAANLARILMGGFDLSQYLRTYSVSAERDAEESHTFLDTAKEFFPTLPGGSVAVEGLWDSTATTGSDAVLRGAITATAKKPWTVYPEGDTLTNRGFGFNADEGSLERSQAVDGLIEITAEATSSVGVDSLISLHALAARTTDANGTAVDGAAASTAGGAAYLHVTAIAGSPTTLDITIEDSADGSTGWATIATFTQVTAANNAERVAIAGTIKRYTRAVWNLDPGTTSATFQVSLARA